MTTLSSTNSSGQPARGGGGSKPSNCLGTGNFPPDRAPTPRKKASSSSQHCTSSDASASVSSDSASASAADTLAASASNAPSTASQLSSSPLTVGEERISASASSGTSVVWASSRAVRREHAAPLTAHWAAETLNLHSAGGIPPSSSVCSFSYSRHHSSSAAAAVRLRVSSRTDNSRDSREKRRAAHAEASIASMSGSICTSARAYGVACVARNTTARLTPCTTIASRESGCRCTSTTCMRVPMIAARSLRLPSASGRAYAGSARLSTPPGSSTCR
mmetsp:Transcript_39862/g.85033  ORF Transcript_39862/g.85033 Transcript_39862/m.85033 type:complete len:276 (-) Transcript_39862:367-1194(-)